MTLTRRRFLGQTAPLGLVPFLPACGLEPPLSSEALPARSPEDSPFQHGVASGDPLSDAVILWTRVTPGADAEGEVAVSWRVARDPALTEVVAEGVTHTGVSQDFTVKVDAGGLAAGTHYYYDFGALDQRSTVGRTCTAPTGSVSHARLAVTSCANYPAGYFNAYRRIAERGDIDFVLHLGDYLYEYPNGVLGDGASIGRMPDPDRETVTLAEYRQRHAQYKRDPDLQEVHRQYPFVAIWDDHEVANNAYRDGASNHQPDSEGDWAARKANAMRA
jgi:alkaline phosphatase D